MGLPANVTVIQVSPEMVQVSGWATEPFVMTEASARRNLERVRSRRASYATPADYERHLSVPLEAMRLMGWEVPPDQSVVPPKPEAAVAPAAPATPASPDVHPPALPAPPAVAVEPTPATQMEFRFDEPAKPSPAEGSGDGGKSWVDEMVSSEKPSQV